MSPSRTRNKILRTNSNSPNYHQKRALSAPAAAVAVVAILVIAYGAYSFFPTSTINTTTSTKTNGPAGSQGVSCGPTTAWQVKQSELPYGGDSLAGTVSMTGYQVGTPNVGWSDLTSASSPATSSGTYAPNGNYLLSYTETSTVLTYPIYNLFSATGTIPSSGEVIGTMGGIPVLTLQCAPSSSNSNANNWNLIATPIQAPTSGTSATTDVETLCIASNGNSLTTHTTTYPTSSTEITCNLNILQAYRGAGYNIPIPGTQQNPVTDYATGQTLTTGFVQREMVGILIANCTCVQAQLDSSAQGITLTPITSNLLVSGTKAWLVTGYTGCAPVSSSAGSNSPVTCLSTPFDTYANTHTGHLGVEFQYTDMQSKNFVLQNLVTSAITGFTTSGSTAGACAGYSSGLTPTSGNDAGTPAPLVKQCYGIINS